MRDYPLKPQIRHRRAVFLDRDGTINIDTHYPHKLTDLKLIPAAVEGLKILSVLSLDIIVISNQGGIALNLFTKEQMTEFNTELRKRVEGHGAKIDAFYYCPHLEKKNLSEGMQGCLCSKPLPGMLLEAASDYDCDLSKSFIVGDRVSDILAGQATGCCSILVNTGDCNINKDILDVIPNYTAENLYEAALIIRNMVLGSV